MKFQTIFSVIPAEVGTTRSRAGIQCIFLVPCLCKASPVLDTGDDVWIPVFTGMTKCERPATTVGEPLCACQPRAGAPKRRKVLTNETKK